MNRNYFPKGFIWGAATAAYQIEGSHQTDGRGESIWDRFSHTPGKIVNGDTGDIACDHYCLYKEDIQIMRDLGLNAYRFSISWSRIFPSGKRKINQKGVDFYKKLVDELLTNNIEPLITLYHWDLPQCLQDKGGWGNRDTVGYFADFASYMFQTLGHEVKKWITINEPWVVAFLGNAEGMHAPGNENFGLAVQVAHHLLLAHAKTVNIFRDINHIKGEIGITLDVNSVYPATDAKEDIQAAIICDGFQHRWFLDPVFKGKYPEDILELFNQKYNSPLIKQGDLEILAKAKVDFLGVNNYYRLVVEKSEDKPLGFAKVKPDEAQYTEMGWEIYPNGLYDLLIRITYEYENVKIFVTENGAAFKDDRWDDGIVIDDDRVDYLQQHVNEVQRAIENGVDIRGYFVWSLLDNFEWAYGYSKRFGLIYVDFDSKRRIKKRSAFWYQDLIKNSSRISFL